jgi:hypothetical protein
MTFLVYIETQNFTRIHIEKSTCSTKVLSINMNKSVSAVTGGLQSYCSYIIASIKCGYWDTVKTFWIILILVRYRQFHLSKHLTFLLLTNHSLWKSINTFKNIIYNAFIFTMISNLFRSSLQFFFCHKLIYSILSSTKKIIIGKWIEVITTVEFRIDDISVEYGGHTFQQIMVIRKEIRCTLLLADL